MLLCDFAQAADGKLYILGGGWSITGPGISQMALAIKIEVPWDLTNSQHQWRLALFDADGQPVTVIGPEGEQEVTVEGGFEVGRPPGLPAGTPIDLPMALNFAGFPLPPGGRYTWRLMIDGEEQDGWQVSFLTRSAPPVQNRRD